MKTGYKKFFTDFHLFPSSFNRKLIFKIDFFLCRQNVAWVSAVAISIIDCARQPELRITT